MNSNIDFHSIKELLDEKYYKYNTPEFIETDPIAVPHSFSTRENIEISAFMAATIAWGQRTSILKNAFRLMKLMDNSPYDFILNSTEKDYKMLSNFCHRTFNSSDTIFFIKSLRNIYKQHGGLESVFTNHYQQTSDIRLCLKYFRDVFFELPHQHRTEKHISDISRKAACKRLNLFLRWMVRVDGKGVDFGIWNDIPTSSLYIPLDVHIGNVGRYTGLLKRKQNDWPAVEELTSVLRKFDSADPVKYDFALFGLGIFEKFTQ
jgi:uncharacterized protein (TIGR02757 family)